MLGLVIFFTPLYLNMYVDSILPELEPVRREQLQASWKPNENRLADELAVFRGGYLGQVSQRLRLTHRPTENNFLDERTSSNSRLSTLLASPFTLMLGSVTRAFGMMLIGMALSSWGALSGKRSSALYQWMAIAGVGLGIPLSAYGYYQNVQHDWRYERAMFVGRNFHIVATLLISFGYVACIMLWVQSNWGIGIRRRLAAVGRMTLTNYILQSLLATTVFYGFGLGLFGFVSRVGQLAVVGGIWALQLTYSPWWLHRYRYGPLEWLWRSLTYRKFLPMQ